MQASPLQIGFSLGSNLGDKIANLAKGRRELLKIDGAREVARSSLYETEPVDVKPEFQHLKFVNAVLILETLDGARDWLEHIARIETQFGRTREGDDKNAPREIDIDIIFAGDQLIGSGGLVVPHPRWAERRFVVQPLAELQPHRILPGTDRTVAQILETLPGADELTRLDADW
ncbi:MAG: 2-amino-4-hydroxy-6-hydroxymethyldihydropteridine diphosphokinase [Verrucomicrobia bacterium]|nr:2-amino-4-hydroxy-6-hydroxymethyldihydropteridine diphosphokinase [Verrucomicrobiota bacterium]MCH8511763.1 2-amino-4-hydroxy-6-hydroxymethyldihydropteridine diphosphokinase [Kiritimatiellia bacterium]